jgi:hypothetical protein
LEYDAFSIHCRYDHLKRIYENTVVLRNRYFRTTFTINIEARVVTEYLKLKQRGVLSGPPAAPSGKKPPKP